MNENIKPYSAVHLIILRRNNNANILGCCFRIWSDNHFLTASHCICDYPHDEIFIFDPTKEDEWYIPVINYKLHENADIAIMEIDNYDLKQFYKFSITKIDLSLGHPLHAFGHVKGLIGNSFRIVPGFSMRDFIFKDNINKYEYSAIELSAPIPKGTSGAPVFSAWPPNQLVGIATGSHNSEIELRNITIYEDDNKIEKEKISEFTRYGIVLDILKVLPWLKENIPGEPIFR